jgi:hypothetical protein
LFRSGAARTLLAAAGSALLLAMAPPAALGQAGPIVNPDLVVAPELPLSDAPPATETTPTETETVRAETVPEEVPDGDPDDEQASRRNPGFGNPAMRPVSVKEAEAANTCKRKDRPPNSKMLAVGGSVGNDEGGSYGWIALAVGAAAAAIAIGVYVLKRRKPEREAALRPLEVTATLVAIVSGLAGLAVQFIPGAGVREPPTTRANLAVREVLARITRGEYAQKTGADVRRIPMIDRREVGLVVWLEVALDGYRDRRPRLQYALYNPDVEGALLVGTGTTIDLRVEDTDTQTLIVPIWVGYPKSAHFQARFRLLDGAAVREIAATGKLNTSPFRYACDTDA